MYYMESFKRQNSPLAKCVDQAFVVTRIKKCKKGNEKLTTHEQSQAHKIAITTHTYQHRNVETQLSTVKEQQQREARSCLLKKFQTVRFLARRGLVLHGHESHEGNLNQLLKVRAEDDDVMKRWLSKHSNHYISPEIQNEISNIMANTIVRTISSTMHELPTLRYFIIIDGVQDVS